jgi:ribonucleoside-diphosphate reductase alpha chain
LQVLGYTDDQVKAIVDHIDKNDTIEGAPDLKAEHLPVFDCAFSPPAGGRSISWRGHVRMMGAAQPFISGAISKTVNMPKDATPEDIADAYMEGWRLGLKALAIYRDGSKRMQPLSTKKKDDKAADKSAGTPRRERLPDTRASVTHKFSVSGHEGYITVGLYPDGRPGELFITMAKEGSTIGGLMDCFGTAVSMSLQYGVPLDVYVNKFSHTRFEPMGFTTNPDVRIAKSIVDYIFRWLGITFLPGYREKNKAIPTSMPDKPGGATEDADAEPKPVATKDGGPSAGQGNAAANDQATTTSRSNGTNGANGTNGRNGTKKSNGASSGNGASNGNGTKSHATPPRPHVSQPVGDSPVVNRLRATEAVEPSGGSASSAVMTEQFASFQSDAPTCDSCGAITVRCGNCYLCYNCGTSMGCS